MKNKYLPHIALFFVALFYGANYSIAKTVMDPGYLQPRAFIVLRVFSAAVLFFFLHTLFVREKLEKSDLRLVMACAVFGVAVNQLCFFSGLKLTTPIHASLIMLSTPIIVFIAAAIILKERITRFKIMGVGLGLLGAYVIIAHGGGVRSDEKVFWGNLLIFINASSYALYLILVKKLMVKYDPFTILKWVFAFGAVLVLPFGVGELAETNWDSFNPKVWYAIAYVLVFTTFFAYLLNAFALKKVGASVAGVYIYLQPILATIIAVFMGMDRLDGIKLMAAALVFTGVFLVGYKPAAEHKS